MPGANDAMKKQIDTWAAKERGFYRRHGIEAEVIAMRPPLTIGAMQAGEIDYAYGASTISRGSISGMRGFRWWAARRRCAVIARSVICLRARVPTIRSTGSIVIRS